MATQIPGAPAEGTPYADGFDRTDLDTVQTVEGASNFTSTTLESDQEVGAEDNYLICDRTGFKLRIEDGVVEEWSGMKVRKQSWERRHPQDFIRSRAESRRNGSPRPEQTDSFIADEYPNGVDADTDI